MGLRITTWNVNGIRNPFGYQPWRDKRTFEGMFDILEADIVVFQETKIQRKDLRDDMVLVPGWDCYWSLPKHKKGYSGVVIYTRNSACAPIRAEEGITGTLAPSNASSSFRDLPEDQQIGGYPTTEQLSLSDVDATALDSEGRCVILEFPAFILLGTYCPATRDETRDDFRLGFLNVLDARIRNLVKMGKRVIWTGDLNISANELDTASAEETMRKNGMDGKEYCSTPSRRIFNQILVGGKVFGPRDEGREQPVMWDVCRAFHEERKGMFTCWETKINARPGNFGARIDYVLCSADMKDWFSDSNIQEGLMGSDHCPVYAAFKDKIIVDNEEVHCKDLVNPPGMFSDGRREQEWSIKNLLPMSGKLIPEFDGRRNIRDMFSRKPSTPSQKSFAEAELQQKMPPPPATANLTIIGNGAASPTKAQQKDLTTSPAPPPVSPGQSASKKRTLKSETSLPNAKRLKSTAQASTNGTSKGQQSLKGFFASKTNARNDMDGSKDKENEPAKELPLVKPSTAPATNDTINTETSEDNSITPNFEPEVAEAAETVAKVEEATAEATKQTWGKLFTKPVSPKCEHNEPCKTMQTKKPGANCGRSFWMCNRPLGPSGNKEKGTQWRCATFIWCSDWDTRANG